MTTARPPRYDLHGLGVAHAKIHHLRTNTLLDALYKIAFGADTETTLLNARTILARHLRTIRHFRPHKKPRA